MTNEDHNNGFHWQAKLDELEILAGETAVNKNVVWKKLYQRLEEKPKRRKAVWYWAAAACVIVILAAGIFIINKNGNDLTAIARIKTSQLSINSNAPLINKNEAAIFVPQKHVNKKQTVDAVEKRESKIVSTRHNAIIIEPAALETEHSAEMIPSTKNFILPQKDKAIALIAAVPVKKKLRVVQINELDNAVNDDAAILTAARPGRGHFQIMLNGNIDFGDGPFVSSNQFDNTFKINLSPKN